MPPPPKKKVGPPPPKIKIPKRELFRAATQDTLFDTETKAEAEWQGMPEFVSKEMLPFHTVNVHFENPDHLKDFEVIIDQKVTQETKYVWHPKKVLLKVANLRYKSSK